MPDLKSQLKRFSETPILVIGDLMMDRYVRGRVSRLSPEAPVPVVDTEQEDFMPGGAGNVAFNVAALGGKPFVVSVVGRDLEGDRLLGFLQEKGVDVQGIERDGSRPTIQKTRIYAGHQQVVRFDKENRTPVGPHVMMRLFGRIKELLGQVRGVVLSDYGKGIVSSPLLRFVLPLARQQKKFVMVDPKVEHFLRYKGVQCVTPNLKEAAEGMRVLPPKTDEEVDALGNKILKKLKCQSVLITRGERGMSLYQSAKKTCHFPSHAQEVFDVTGAGDTVISTFSLALAAGCSYVDAAHLSNVAAGIVVGKLGTATVSQEEIINCASLTKSVGRKHQF